MWPDLVGFCSRECFQHPFFPVVLQDRLCLGFISFQSLDNCLWSIILTLNKRLPSQIINSHGFGRVELDVVDTAAAWMDPASSKALLDDLKGHVQVNHCVYLIGSIQGFCLRKCPWKAIQQPVILGEIFQLMKDQPSHDIVWDELPLVNESLG